MVKQPCEGHSGIVAEMRAIGDQVVGVKQKLDRIERLLLFLSMAVGAMAAAVGVSGDVAKNLASVIAGNP